MIKNIILLAIIVLLIDVGFIYSIIFKDFNNMITKIQNSPININIFAVIICYIILVFAIYYFVIYKKASYLDTFLLGFIIYATYELTNMAVFKDWNLSIVIIDSLWGGTMFIITKYIYNYLVKFII